VDGLKDPATDKTTLSIRVSGNKNSLQPSPILLSIYETERKMEVIVSSVNFVEDARESLILSPLKLIYDL
jgi:hypothetical protein